MMEQNKEMNFMGAENFKLSAFARMEMVLSSAILAEPQYYRDSKAALPTKMNQQCLFADYVGKSAEEIFMSSLYDALSEDFEAVLKFAVRLRNEGYMRLGRKLFWLKQPFIPLARPLMKSTHLSFVNPLSKSFSCLPTCILNWNII